MSNPKPARPGLFHFKKFSLSDSNCGMKIGTDSVLLGSVAATYNSLNVLDVGTGCGIIALMIAQKNPGNILAVEIEDQAVQQAIRNVHGSPWADRIQVVHSSFQDYASSANRKFDLIVCNPPFFHNSLHSSCKQRNIARHSTLLNPEDLFNGARMLMEENSKLLLIIPSDQAVQYLQQANHAGIFPSGQINILPSAASPPKRLILEFSVQKKSIHKINTLIIENKGRHDYSEKYKELTRDYYLHF